MGKKTKGRKRHIVVDVLGCMLSVDAHAANIHDTKSGISTAKEAYTNYPSIQKFCTDAGYRGTFVSDLKEKCRYFGKNQALSMGKTSLALGC